MLRSDLEAPRKQRHTARRILARLIDEHGLVDMTYSSVALCAAIVDQLTFGGNIIETGTESYRLAHTRAKRAAAARD